jgi:hypothetical protein
VRDRYVLQVLLVTLGYGVLLVLIAVANAAMDDARAPAAVAPYSVMPAGPPVALMPNATLSRPEGPLQRSPAQTSPATSDPTFYVTASRIEARHHCPQAETTEEDSCREIESSKPGHGKRC